MMDGWDGYKKKGKREMAKNGKKKVDAQPNSYNQTTQQV